jgi:hypothetical protein
MHPSFEPIPRFVLAVAQDVYELVLTGRLDLAEVDGAAAAARAHATFLARQNDRPPLSDLCLSFTPVGREAFSEVLAFSFGWIDGMLQVPPMRAEWISARQACYREVLSRVRIAAPYSEAEMPALGDLLTVRAAEYGPSPTDAFVALAIYVQRFTGKDSLQVGASVGAYVAAASIEIFKSWDPPSPDAPSTKPGMEAA